MLMTSVIANRTRPEAIRALISTPDDSGNWSAMLAAIGVGLDWLIRLKVTTPDTDRMIVTAIVSPSARPRPSIEPLITAERPNGSTAIRIISHRVAPRASAPSWSLLGVCENTSRATAETIGMTITASTIPATSIARPVVDAGPAKNGMKLSLSASHSITGTIAGPRTNIPHSPYTMLGIAASRSTR